MNNSKKKFGLTFALCAVLCAWLITGCSNGTAGGDETLPVTSATEETALQNEKVEETPAQTEAPEEIASQTETTEVTTLPMETTVATDLSPETTLESVLEPETENETTSQGATETVGKEDTPPVDTSASTEEPVVTEPPHEHLWSEWTVETAPTCTRDGVEKRACACGESEKRRVAAGHSYVEGICEACGERKPSEGLEFLSNGDGTCKVIGLGQCTDTEIVVPAVSPWGEKVTRIGDYAFQEQDHLTGVVIPEGVTIIGNDAFALCTGLARVSIAGSVTSIDRRAFFDCGSLTDITFTGTMAQWATVEKQEFWDAFVRTDVIHCADGDAPRA